MPYTLGEAAKATGKSKPTIQRAIKNSLISAARNEDGSYAIDPAELHRVFPPVSCTSNVIPDMKQSEPHPLQREVEVLRERLADKDAVIDDLRQRLDQEGEERRKVQTQLTALLTDQRAQTAPPEPAIATPTIGLWWWLLPVLAIGGVAAWWLFGSPPVSHS